MNDYNFGMPVVLTVIRAVAAALVVVPVGLAWTGGKVNESVKNVCEQIAGPAIGFCKDYLVPLTPSTWVVVTIEIAAFSLSFVPWRRVNSGFSYIGQRIPSVRLEWPKALPPSAPPAPLPVFPVKAGSMETAPTVAENRPPEDLILIREAANQIYDHFRTHSLIQGWEELYPNADILKVIAQYILIGNKSVRMPLWGNRVPSRRIDPIPHEDALAMSLTDDGAAMQKIFEKKIVWQPIYVRQGDLDIELTRIAEAGLHVE